MADETGILYLVSTPIGNLRDITWRAIDVLGKVELIAAEDTRHTRMLLQHYDIKTPTTSYYEYNKKHKTPELLLRLQQGKSIAVVSDAGTPGISDPAFYLVREAIKNQISVVAIPGATAFVPALIISGLPTDRFVFEGFLPTKKGRKKRLENLVNETRTIILYESPRRLIRTLKDLLLFLGDRPTAIVREITKKFEEIKRGPLSLLLSQVEKTPPRGEFVLIIGGKPKE